MWSDTKRKGKRTRCEIRKFWRSHVEAQGASGLTGAAYCRQQGLRVKSLYRWRQLLCGTDALSEQERSLEKFRRPVFAEIRVGAAETVSVPCEGEGPARVEVVARDGRAIRVWPGFDGDTLARVLAVVEGATC